MNHQWVDNAVGYFSRDGFTRANATAYITVALRGKEERYLPGTERLKVFIKPKTV
jgi:hypothetical protein